MRSKSIIVAVSILTLVNLIGAPASQAAAPRFQHLDPGGQPRLTEQVPVNVVFVGYDRFTSAASLRWRGFVLDVSESGLPHGLLLAEAW